jgi:hypothetical protein
VVYVPGELLGMVYHTPLPVRHTATSDLPSPSVSQNGRDCAKAEDVPEKSITNPMLAKTPKSVHFLLFIFNFSCVRAMPQSDFWCNMLNKNFSCRQNQQS